MELGVFGNEVTSDDGHMGRAWIGVQDCQIVDIGDNFVSIKVNSY